VVAGSRVKKVKISSTGIFVPWHAIRIVANAFAGAVTFLFVTKPFSVP
jgi:hypothetical protein